MTSGEPGDPGRREGYPPARVTSKARSAAAAGVVNDPFTSPAVRGSGRVAVAGGFGGRRADTLGLAAPDPARHAPSGRT